MLGMGLGQLSLLDEGGKRRNSGPSWTLSRSPQSWVTMPSIVEAFGREMAPFVDKEC
jgi:hypothetical protein